MLDTVGITDRASFCVRGPWCEAATIGHQPDGTTTRVPAPSPRPFCDDCRTRIEVCAGELPSAYQRLEAELGQPVRRSEMLRTPLGPSLPLRENVDATMRAMAETLLSWHERVAAAASLAAPDTQATRHSYEKAVTRACAVITAHIDALLSLPSEPMTRLDGDTLIFVELDGTDAGMEILTLHRKARVILGETHPPRETFDGIPCRSCGDAALERAEPPSDPAIPAKHSRCASCGHTMDTRTYTQWAAWYSRWAEKAVTICRRCAKGDHGGCQWHACACAAAHHQAA